MTTREQNNIKALEMLRDEIQGEFNNAISMYELALECPEYYDVECYKEEMDKQEKYLQDILEEIEIEKSWLAFSA